MGHDCSTDAEKQAECIAELEQNLRRGSRALNWLLSVQPLAPGERLLILVDQFEELFRFQRGHADDAAAFVALLLAAAGHPDCYLFITMRSEFLGDCSRYPDLPETNAGLFLTPRLSPEQLADAIQLPARLPEYGSDVNPDLVRRLLIEIAHEQDQLPLLQRLLMRLWDAAVAKVKPGPSWTRLALRPSVASAPSWTDTRTRHSTGSTRTNSAPPRFCSGISPNGPRVSATPAARSGSRRSPMSPVSRRNRSSSAPRPSGWPTATS